MLHFWIGKKTHQWDNQWYHGIETRVKIIPESKALKNDFFKKGGLFFWFFLKKLKLLKIKEKLLKVTK